MHNPKSIFDIDLHPEAGKKYYNSVRSWEKENIYFLIVDRFHDGKDRVSISTQGKGFGSYEELQKAYGGTIKGITNNLSYLKNLGCTAIWLSPVFENNPHDYHGYAIRNFLNVDPRFGTKEDLKELVEKAHQMDMKIFLDTVINHSGDNWQYEEGEKDPVYNKGVQYKFGGWHSEDYPVPVELRNRDYYKKKGYITKWDNYPETVEGDFFSLKKFNHDDSDAGLALQEILLKVYCYWIKEVDCDGFRIDAAKHIGELPAARFSTKIKEYATLLGKDNFFIFGEVASDDKITTNFVQPMYSEREKRVYQGFDSILDFPLHYCLSKVVQGTMPFNRLIERYESVKKNFYLRKGESFTLVNFLDNHDQIESPNKKRIAAQLTEKQLVAALGILVCLPGVPCIYYGTEQAFKGEGDSDAYIREAMFDAKSDKDALSQQSFIYGELSKLLNLRKEYNELAGRLLFPVVSLDGINIDKKILDVVVFSRRLFDQEIFVAYNTSLNTKKRIYIQVANVRKEYKIIYGETSALDTEQNSVGRNKSFFLRLNLEPMGLVIFK